MCSGTISRPRFNEACSLARCEESGHHLRLSKVCPRNVSEPSSAIHFRVQTCCGSVLIFKWLQMKVNCVVSSNQCLRHTRTMSHFTELVWILDLLQLFSIQTWFSTGSQLTDQMCKTSLQWSNSYEKNGIRGACSTADIFNCLSSGPVVVPTWSTSVSDLSVSYLISC